MRPGPSSAARRPTRGGPARREEINSEGAPDPAQRPCFDENYVEAACGPAPVAEAFLQKEVCGMTDPPLLAPVHARGGAAEVPSAPVLHFHKHPGRPFEHQEVDFSTPNPQIASKQLQSLRRKPIRAQILSLPPTAMREWLGEWRLISFVWCRGAWDRRR